MLSAFQHMAASVAAQATLRRRRQVFLTLVITTSLALLALMGGALFDGGVDTLGIGIMLLFAITLPWTTIGFWNAVIGFWLMHFSRDAAAEVAPHLRSITGTEPITQSTALLVCIRHEDTERLERNLGFMLEGLQRSGHAPWFHLYMLSDSDDTEIIHGERLVAARLTDRFGSQLKITYRRRETHEGYKAGNIRDFCDRWGSQHRFALVLDADSVMTSAAMLRLVRIMQAQPQIGILQTLVTGLPSTSPFARIFQFGMRLGMRSYTLGAASWQGDCGPYWGHNAIIRLAPFIEHCHLPLLPGKGPLSGHVLSHDQLEAVLMRRAGYEVRVLPEEDGSWEENPPTMPEFIRRDLRWCQGNLQYLKLLRMPGLLPVSRAQLWLAIAMYVGAPAWLGMIALGLLRDLPVDITLFQVLFATTMTMCFAPKFATLGDVLLRPELRSEYGGTGRVLISALMELVFSVLMAPIVAVSITLFMLGLPFGRQIGWAAQQRDAVGLSWADASRRLWLHTTLGLVLGLAFWQVFPATFWLWLPFVVGLSASIPLAVVTADPRLGRWLAESRLCRIPEEARLPHKPEYAVLFTPFGQSELTQAAVTAGAAVAAGGRAE